jgi:hypothetical protein
LKRVLPGKVIGRVVVDRAIRVGTGGALAVAELAPARSAPTTADLRCSRCGAVVCEAVRVKLFSGIVLQCTGCGQANRVPR